MIHALYRYALRGLLAVFQRVRRLIWSITRPDVHGAHAIALTPAGRIILVRLSYAQGWHLPGGGRRSRESATQNVLRELREEIGMVAHDDPFLARELQERSQYRLDHAAIFIIRNVAYRPNRWSIEIEEVIEADLESLPPDLSRRALGWIESLRDELRASD